MFRDLDLTHLSIIAKNSSERLQVHWPINQFNVNLIDLIKPSIVDAIEVEVVYIQHIAPQPLLGLSSITRTIPYGTVTNWVEVNLDRPEGGKVVFSAVNKVTSNRLYTIVNGVYHCGRKKGKNSNYSGSDGLNDAEKLSATRP
ncbi:MAG TPA: hypothetical protein VLF94_02615 [Chlamydiales bacterium]|nr:hypothetical protein [Chlamydiales bacterium]